jgi:poly(3-hydroxybutyrate) depolymerase
VFEKDGAPVIEYWKLEGLDHGTPIAAGDGPENCGRTSQWALDAGICSSLHIARFWGIAK